MENFNMKKFRSIRQLFSSFACIGLTILVVLLGRPQDNFLMKALLIVLGTGVFYCAFALAGIVSGFTRNGFVKTNKALNCVVDTLIYLALCVGAFFLVTFIINKVIWLGLLFALGGAFEVYRDIHYLVELDEQRYNETADNNNLEPTIQ